MREGAGHCSAVVQSSPNDTKTYYTCCLPDRPRKLTDRRACFSIKSWLSNQSMHLGGYKGGLG